MSSEDRGSGQYLRFWAGSHGGVISVAIMWLQIDFRPVMLVRSAAREQR